MGRGSGTARATGRRARALRGALALAFAILVAALAGPAGAVAKTTDSILVKVKPGADVHAVAKRHGMRVRRYLPQIHWVELAPRKGSGASASAAASPRALARRADGDPAVRAVDAGSAGERVGWDFVPRDPVFNTEFKFEDGTQLGWHFFLPNFPIAWDMTQGVGTNVAVIDSEFDTANPDLGPKLVLRYNVASGTPQYHTGNVGFQTGDVFHGSHTSGLVGAKTDNGEGVAGACFECGVIAIKIGSQASGTFVDASFLGDVAEGLIYAADHGASVISMSLGGPRPHQPLADAVNYAAAKGAVIVASAGNSEETNPGVANYPAAYPNVIGVGATDSKDQIAPFSTQGSFVDVVAPGVNVLSTENAADPEAQVFLEDPNPRPTIAVKSGTSMAAPIVAGLAALMRSVRPDLSAPEVESLIKSTAKDLGIGGPDPTYGWGRIDAGAAVAAARSYVRPLPPPAPAPAPAPAPKKPVRRIGARLTLKTKRHKGNLIFFGKVKTADKCKAKRTVLLLGKHLKKPLAHTGTNKRGFFHLKLRRSPHREVRVKVKASKVNSRLLCQAGGSRFLRR